MNIKYNTAYESRHWLKCQFGGKTIQRWKTLQHNGVMFPPEYEPHNIPIIYNGKRITLNPEAEEYATFYAKYIGTEYINNTFNKNFWRDWKKTLKNDNIKDLDGVDFGLIVSHILKKQEIKKTKSKEEKEQDKRRRDKEEKPFKIAIIDGIEQKVGNFRVEPPSIFLGRGCHPKLGSIKRRIYPEDITINIGENDKVPKVHMYKNRQWGEIVHEHNSIWLASWKDDISGKTKYVWLGDDSKFKAEGDMEKFDKARRLKKKINSIRESYFKDMKSNDPITAQLATALYFIDELALRIGNEKSSDEADTVGVLSLRVEHIELLPDGIIKLDFLGKDSIRYVKKFKVDDYVYSNITEFIKGKNKKDDIFDLIRSDDMNKYLQGFMEGLTAKVFRTFNASNLFQKELTKISSKFSSDSNDKINLILNEFNKANAKVALLCNHQKKVSKTFNEQIDKLNVQIKKLKGKKNKTEKMKSKLRELKAKKELKMEMKSVSLGTSKVNYIDPRITIAFIKKHNIPIDKVFQNVLQNKFKWAMDVDEDFKF